MKIAYLIATRGNPRRAGACIEIARSLASGKHEIDYILGVDRDDKSTIKYFWDFYPDSKDPVVIINIADRAPALGSIWNRLALCTDADAFCVMGDDVFVTSRNWDEGVSQFCKPGSVSVVAWTDTGSPNQPTYPIISRGWYSVAGLYTDYFPFWFDDTWVAETWHFTSGSPIYISNQLIITSKHGKTKRMRDLKFWWNFFSATRGQRITKSIEIRKALGSLPADPAVLELIRRRWELRDDECIQGVDQLEANFSPDIKASPSAEYLVALANAQEMMRGFGK